MSQYQDGQDITLSISEDLSAKQYYAIKVGASDNAGLVNDTKGGDVVGILQEKVDGSSTDKPGRVRITGNSKAKIGGAVTRGDQLISAADGRLIAKDAANQHVIGLALESGSANDIISIVIQHRTSHA